jgi:hypothetical protein
MFGALDRHWHAHGATSLKRRFVNTVGENRQRAELLLQDDATSFPVIYILRDDIERLELTDSLTAREKYALYITAHKAGDKSRAALYEHNIADLDGVIRPTQDALSWMITTGADWDGPSAGRDDYDAAIDAAVAFFADRFDDPETMKIAAGLIFRRNRLGLNVHDLAWGFFLTAEPNALSYVAKHLLSDNPADVELTCKLMSFDDPVTKDGRRALYEEYLAWLTEHRPYLYATAEHFNSTSKPYSVRHDREAKFLRREIEPRGRTPKKPLTDLEYQQLLAHRANREDITHDND